METNLTLLIGTKDVRIFRTYAAAKMAKEDLESQTDAEEWEILRVTTDDNLREIITYYDTNNKNRKK